MNFKLRINDKLDSTLLQNFPRDPYSDIKIITTTEYLELSLAYLSIDSQYFAGLSNDCKEIDLSVINEEALILVLRALYGGQLQVNTIGNLQEIYKVIKLLQIDQFIKNICLGLKALHEGKKENSLLNNMEMLEFCIKNDVIKDVALHHHFENHLKILQSSKNYLQLVKLSDQTLNFILLQYQKVHPQGDSTINHIIQNYFNRKSYRPAEYFSTPNLEPLKEIWEKFHYKITKAPPNKLQKMSSVQPTQSVRQPHGTRYSEILSTDKLGKLGKLANFNAINTQSINLETQYFKFESINDEHLLDSRIQKLTKDLDQKNNKIKNLQSEIKELMELKQKRQKNHPKTNIGESTEDLTLLIDIARSKKQKQELCKTDRSQNPNEYAYDNVKKPVEQERQARQGKIKIVSKNIMSKKMFP